MKKILVIASAALLMIGCGGRGRINGDIRTHRAQVATNATYDMERVDLYQALYKTISSKYTVAKESESKGTIETQPAESSTSDRTRTTKRYITSEIIGSKKPYRVDFQSITETSTFVTGKGVTNTSTRNKRAEEDLAILLYEQINGKIELSGVLKTRVENNNNAAKREGQKIYY